MVPQHCGLALGTRTQSSWLLLVLVQLLMLWSLALLGMVAIATREQASKWARDAMGPMLLLAVADKGEVFDVVVFNSIAMWLLLVVAIITSYLRSGYCWHCGCCLPGFVSSLMVAIMTLSAWFPVPLLGAVAVDVVDGATQYYGGYLYSWNGSVR